MFQSQSLFQQLRCPDINCTRQSCLFSHRTDIPSSSSTLDIQIQEPQVASTSTSTSITPKPARSPTNDSLDTSVPAKRPVTMRTLSHTPPVEPPRKLRKLISGKDTAVRPPLTHKQSGEPILRLNAAVSLVPLPVRQTMLKNLYNHFMILYENIHSTNPHLATEHSLRQEEEVYKQSGKLTYRNAVINTIARIKKRDPPDSASHPSVGTEEDIANQAQKSASIAALRLTRDNLTPLIMSTADLSKWGFYTEVPDNPGGTEPSIEGKVANCDRCAQPFQVKRREEADECVFHWGKAYSRTVNGERLRLFNCCSKPFSEGGGCARGPHVFYESDLQLLHTRHAFSTCPPPQSKPSNALDVVVLDCEMIYSTGGMRVARVSVVDGSGKEVFDEHVRMDDGVEVIDFNTRFSGITEENYSTAILDLASVRQSLHGLIDSDTIIVGHALENDLKTLRIIHHRCVDTAILFPHKQGPPYRRALRDLVKEHLGKTIQTGGGTVGHSSVEDSIATLDLVRWYVLNKSKAASSKGSAIT